MDMREIMIVRKVGGSQIAVYGRCPTPVTGDGAPSNEPGHLDIQLARVGADVWNKPREDTIFRPEDGGVSLGAWTAHPTIEGGSRAYAKSEKGRVVQPWYQEYLTLTYVMDDYVRLF